MTKHSFLWLSSLFLLLFLGTEMLAQNRNFVFNLALGAAHTGLAINPASGISTQHPVSAIAGFQFQKRLSKGWALNLSPYLFEAINEGATPRNLANFDRVKTSTTFLSFALHPKYFISKKFYCSLGPELSLRLSSYGSTYRGQQRQTYRNESNSLKEVHVLASFALGISGRIGSSRKNAVVPIDAFWFTELRLKRGLNDINALTISEDTSIRVSGIEWVVGLSLASLR